MRNILQSLHLRLAQLLNLVNRHIPKGIISPPAPLRIASLQAPGIPTAPRRWLLAFRGCVLFIVATWSLSLSLSRLWAVF